MKWVRSRMLIGVISVMAMLVVALAWAGGETGGEPENLEAYSRELHQAFLDEDLKKSEELLTQIEAKFDPETVRSGETGVIFQLIKGNIYAKIGRDEEAMGLFKAALPRVPDHAGTSQLVLTSKSLLAEIYLRRGDEEASEKLITETLRELEENEPGNLAGLSLMLNNVGYLYQQQKQYDKAEAYLRRALEKEIRLSGENSLDTALACGSLCRVLIETRKLSEAEGLCKRSISLYEKKQVPDHPNAAISMKNLGLVYRAQGRKQEALEQFDRSEILLRKAHDFMQDYYGRNHTDVIQVQQAIHEVQEEKASLAGVSGN